MEDAGERPYRDEEYVKKLKLKFKIPNGRFYIKQQYYLFDLNALIADVGGYLGLLLGHSALGLFYTMADQCAIRKKAHISNIAQ